MRLLELFKGTGSVGNAVGSHFDEVISLDFDPKCNATICVDILKWDYKVYPVGYFDYIWASPDCREYSSMRNIIKKPRDLELADSIVLKTLEIIDYFKPKVWFIENPDSSMLKTRPFMEELPYVICDYCQFANWGYRKRTRIWTNQNGLSNVLCNRATCQNMEGTHHKSMIGNTRKGMNGSQGKDKLHRIPPKLVKYLFKM